MTTFRDANEPALFATAQTGSGAPRRPDVNELDCSTSRVTGCSPLATAFEIVRAGLAGCEGKAGAGRSEQSVNNSVPNTGR
jgi:hypothetical protein